MSKERLDQLIFELGYADSREKAKRMIMAGEVKIGTLVKDKPGEKVDVDSEFIVKSSSQKYVSRGGFKLEKAIDEFAIDLSGKICMDVGASTGGFTDCMLQNGAAKVYSVDVGYGQLDWKLRNDERVVNLEKTNARYLNEETVIEKVDFVSIDVSFISLEIIVPSILGLISEDGLIMALIKPQFEAGREKVGKNGVVRDKAVHKQVLQKLVEKFKNLDLGILNLSYSPIKGPKGNIEYLILLSKKDHGLDPEVDLTVESAHNNL